MRVQKQDVRRGTRSPRTSKVFSFETWGLCAARAVMNVILFKNQLSEREKQKLT